MEKLVEGFGDDLEKLRAVRGLSMSAYLVLTL